MKHIQTDYEILEYAIDREYEARQFYLALAEKEKNRALKLLLESLAAEEDEHAKKLELEMMKIGRVVQPGKKDHWAQKYDAMIEFEDNLNIGYRDIVEMGMEKEDAAFRTYVNLAGMIHDPNSRQMLLALAEEEVNHKIRWEAEFNELMQNEP